jgi:CDP-diacylglycerol---glycerol-3-phosphate 3-phosphatidyltransferase
MEFLGMFSIPNIFTFTRIALIPIFVLIFYVPSIVGQYTAAIIFCVAAFTDWLDGFLARRLNQTTRFGAFLDPVADKLLVACALVLIAVEFKNFAITIPAIIIVCREIVISALREWMAEVGEQNSVKVNWLGKVKTCFQFFAITCLLAQPAQWDLPLVWVGVGLMYLAVALTIWSMTAYLRAAWSTFR